MEQPCFRPTVCMSATARRQAVREITKPANRVTVRPAMAGFIFRRSSSLTGMTYRCPHIAHVQSSRSHENDKMRLASIPTESNGQEERRVAGKVVPGAIGRLTDLGKQRKGPVRQAFLSFDRGSDCFKHRLQLYYRLYMPRNVMFQCHARAAAAADLMMIMMMMKAGRLNLGR